MRSTVVICSDFDPVLPEVLARKPRGDIWDAPFRRLRQLVERAGDALPPITWLLRSDASVRFASGAYASAYLGARDVWERLRAKGHEIGWHLHAMSPGAGTDPFRFDPRPDWLAEAKAALEEAVGAPMRSTRTGWDWADSSLLGRLDALGVEIDLSALPGNLVWQRLGADTICVDWRRTARRPYHPDREDYQREGAQPLRLLEVPVYQFPNPLRGRLLRLAWRCRNGRPSLRGLDCKTLHLTADWGGHRPRLDGVPGVFFFHPEDLADGGLERMLANLETLRALPARFVTAGALADEREAA